MDDPLLMSYRTYVHRIRNFRLLGGVLHNSTIPAGMSYCTAFLAAFLCFCMSCSVLNLVRIHIKNLGAITRGMSFCGSLIATSVKATCIAVKRKKLIELEETLEKLFEEELNQNSRTKSIVLSLLHTFDKPSYLYSFLAGGTLSVYIFPPLISIIRQHVNHVEPKKYSLPFPGRFPWTFEGGGFIYQLHFLFETSVTWFLYFTNSGGDTLFGYYIFHIASLLKAMTFKLKNPESNEDTKELLKSCVKKHQKLLHCRDLLQNIYGPIILYLVVTNAVIMCALIFQGTQIQNMSFGKGALLGFYLFMKLTQTFMYAWYGGVVTFESEKFREGLYHCNWMGEDGKRLKTGIVITMLQKPMTVTASGFFYVSVDMFSKVLNTTMSYFFLLQTLDESG